MNTTPALITKLKPGEVFVFGSNLHGRHGKGAAKRAVDDFGAKYGKGVGRWGNTYAIPTKDGNLKVLSRDIIESYVIDFIDYVVHHPENTFLITRIGCGEAGYTDEQIAPLFLYVLSKPNVTLPQTWGDILTPMFDKIYKGE